jgi:rhodanese-related sulfurtransferase
MKPQDTKHSRGRSPSIGKGVNTMDTTVEADGLPIACTLEAGELAKRGEWLRRDVFAAAEERQELPDGFAYRFPGSDEFKDKLFAFVAAERTCCSFFRIELAFTPGLGPIWLTLRGPEGTKDFVRRPFNREEVGEPDASAIATIEREALKALLDQAEDLTIVEAMPEPYYRKAHLPGAIDIPVERIAELAPRLLPDKGAAIVVYCANLPCPNSEMAARALIRLGYTNVRDYAAGKQNWLEAGYPTERDLAARAA